MSDTFGKVSSEAASSPKRTMARSKIEGKPSEADITKKIGTGDDAKNSIVWVTVRWCFIIGGLTSLAIYLRPTYCGVENYENLINDVKAIWTVFMPVITLALGYVFGKGR